MTYIVSNWDSISPWLLGWGEKMQIIAPHDLRDQIAETARRMVAKKLNLTGWGQNLVSEPLEVLIDDLGHHHSHHRLTE